MADEQTVPATMQDMITDCLASSTVGKASDLIPTLANDAGAQRTVLAVVVGKSGFVGVGHAVSRTSEYDADDANARALQAAYEQLWDTRFETLNPPAS